MTRLSLILLLTLAACAPNTRQDIAKSAYPSARSDAPNSASAGTRPSSEDQRLERVGKRILAVAAALCGSFDTNQDSGQTAQTSEAGNCDYPIVISEESEANAFTDGRRVRITRRLVRFASSDAELAFTIAHEVAHNLLGHKSRTLFGDYKQLEYQADRLGLQLVARAGYEPRAAVKLLRRLATSDPRRDRPHPYYPSFSNRADSLQDLAEEIELRLSKGSDEDLKILLSAIAKGV